jgi:ABC-type glycerol-3-phosphate transport system substrate-binding protein
MPYQADALEDKVVIVTSYPKDLTGPFKKAFEAKHPGTTVEVLQKKTSAGVKYIQETAQGNTSDLMWASAPDAFEVLKGDGLLTRYAPKAKGIPKNIGSYPINDPDGYYIGFAGSGYGIMWNTRYLKAKKIPVPKEWADLKKPVYHDHVGMSEPLFKAKAGIKAGQPGKKWPAILKWSPSAVSAFPKVSTAGILAWVSSSIFSVFRPKPRDFPLILSIQR